MEYAKPFDWNTVKTVDECISLLEHSVGFILKKKLIEKLKYLRKKEIAEKGL